MALENLVSKRPAPTQIGPNLILDALVRESHDFRSEVTEFPVETGSNVSDHILNAPREISIEGVITNNPIRFLGGIPAKLIRGSSVGGIVIGPNLNLVELAFAELERIYNAKDTLIISTPRKFYTKMVMTRLSIPKDRATGDALRFSASFRQLERVQSRTVERLSTNVAQERSKPVADTGKQTTPPTTPKAETRLRSALFGIFN